jgi:IS5 family transposase
MGFSYEELHFHLIDSASYRTFCRFGVLEGVPATSTLAENVKKVRAETLEEINRLLVKRAAKARDGVEKGRKVRIDSTVVEANAQHGVAGARELLLDHPNTRSRMTRAPRISRRPPLFLEISRLAIRHPSV